MSAFFKPTMPILASLSAAAMTTILLIGRYWSRVPQKTGQQIMSANANGTIVDNSVEVQAITLGMLGGFVLVTLAIIAGALCYKHRKTMTERIQERSEVDSLLDLNDDPHRDSNAVASEERDMNGALDSAFSSDQDDFAMVSVPLARRNSRSEL